jgi:regulation of enolase protein 1 (concanavalin A-like superfamily)
MCLTLSAATAWAFWTAGSVLGGYGAAAVSSVNQGATPTGSVAGNAVTVTWAPTTLTTGQAVSGYTVKRYSGSTAQTILTACTGTITSTSCVESNVPTGVWNYSVTPVFATHWVGVESAKSANVVVGNVAPTALADSYTVAEDAPLTIGASGVLGNDSDPNSDPLTAILASGVANGVITLNANGAFTYTPNPAFNGTDSFSYKANDGTQNSSVVTVTLTVTAVNDAPLNSVPGPQQTPKNTNRVFSAANSNPISIGDVDAGSATVRVQLTATSGTVTLPVLTSLSFTVGDGTADATMTFSGTIANINLALVGATFIPTNNFSGAATLQIVTSDLGNTGTGGALTDTDTITINVNALGIFTANQDTGTPGQVGSSAYSAGTYTVIGSGGDIWGTTDQFQFLSRDLTGDGRLTAKVVSELPAGTNAAAKAGVMFRESIAAGSRHAYMDMMQTNGSEFLWRTATDGSTTANGTGGLAAPYWVRITRVGDLITAQRSPDGVTWTTQGTTQSVPMTTSVKVGLAVTSHDNTKLLTATFDNVALTTPPTALADAYTTNEDATLGVAAPGVLSNDTDPESDALTAVLVSGTAGLTLNANGSFAYVPPANFSGVASFTYKANDGVFDSATTTVNLTVNAHNQVPSFTKGANQADVVTDGPQTVAGWATAISQGTGDSGQLVDFIVTNNNNSLFSVQPTISPAGTLTYTLAGGTGSATATVKIHDNGGTANGGTDTSSIQSFTITVDVNARPFVTASGTNLSFTENGSAVALDSSITVTDSDSNITGATVSMTTNYVNGQDTLGFTTQNGITGSWVAATGVLTLSGTTTPANYQTALRSITYSNTSDNLVTNNHNVDFVVSDAIGVGNTSSRQVAVTAVNDAPVNTVPASQTTYRNTAEVFSAGNGSLISVTDVDAATVQVQLVSTNGTTTLFGAMPGALTFSVGDGTSDATMTFTGTKAAVNTALNGLGFNPTTGFTGAASLQIVTSDQGATGSGGTLTDNDTVAISVVLDLGIFTASQDIGGPGTAGSSSHSAGTYTVAGGGADIWNNADQFQFLSMPMTGDGRLTAKVVSQTQTPTTNIAAKAGVMFREALTAGSIQGMMNLKQANGSELEYRLTTNGPSAFTTKTTGIAAPYWVRITRVGNIITGDSSPDGVTWTQQGAAQSIPMTSSIYVGLAVSAVDNAKLNTATFSNVAFEQPPVLATSGGTTAHIENVPVAVDSGITLTDATSATMASGTVTVGSGYTAGQDVLAFTNQNGIGGSWSAPTMTLTGSATTAQWQTALQSITYNNTSNTPNTGNRTINYVVNDASFNSNTAAKTVSVTAVNDAPVNSVPGAQTTTMNTAKVFSTGNGNLISITDADAAGGTMQVQLVSTNGVTTLSTLTGLTFTVGDGTADASMTFTGTFAAVNTALAGLSFNPTTSFTGAASLQIVTADQGNTGSGGTLTDSDTIAITVTAAGSTLKAQYRNNDVAGPANNAIQPHLQLVNTGASSVDLGTITVRYWFTKEAGASTFATNCYYATIGNTNVTTSVIAVTPRTGADSYLLVSFPSSTLAAGASSEAQFGFNKTDWSNFDETDDYSYGTDTSYTDSTKVTVYQNGTLIWGTEP